MDVRGREAAEPPATGRDTREVSYAGRQWQLYSETVTTSDPGLRRVTLWVANMPSSRDTSSVQERALLSLDRAAQITAGNQIAAKKLSVREAEALVKKIGAEFSLVPQKPQKEKSRDLKRVEEELSDLLMAEVEVRVKKRVKRNGRVEDMGELAIQFGSLEALNGLIDRLRG